MFEDFKEECINELGEQNYKKIEKVLELFDSEPFEDFEKDGVTVSCSREKINQLQENVCVSIYNDDFEIELMYENGINNGTQLNDYAINPNDSMTNVKREYDVIIGLELDIDAIDAWSRRTGIKYSITKAQALLDNETPEILKLIKDQNYDNYVTGGGTNKTDNYYQNKRNGLNDRGLYWKTKTKTHSVPANFV